MNNISDSKNAMDLSPSLTGFLFTSAALRRVRKISKSFEVLTSSEQSGYHETQITSGRYCVCCLYPSL